MLQKYHQAKELWDKPRISLNRVQRDAANLAFTKPFQLIQGPPGGLWFLLK